jgi:TolA-binding protein
VVRDAARTLASAPFRWDAARTERGINGLRRRRTRRTLSRASLLVTALLAIVAVRMRPAEPLAARASAPEAEAVAGSRQPVAGPEAAVAAADAWLELPALDVPRRTDARSADRTRSATPGSAARPVLSIRVFSTEFAVARDHTGRVQLTYRGELLAARPAGARAAARDEVADLLAQADALRRADDARAAAPLMRTILARHRRDPRAPAAAFTLGRILLDDGDAAAAARAFADARALAPRGPLASDALAREADAWARAGDHDRAIDRATQYLADYPDGARASAMRRHVEP